MCKNNSETWFQIFAFFILPVGGQTNRWWPYWTRTYPSSWHLPVQLPSLVSTICMAFSAQQRDIWQHRGQSHSQNNLVSFHREEKLKKKKGDEKRKKNTAMFKLSSFSTREHLHPCKGFWPFSGCLLSVLQKAAQLMWCKLSSIFKRRGSEIRMDVQYVYKAQ